MAMVATQPPRGEGSEGLLGFPAHMVLQAGLDTEVLGSQSPGSPVPRSCMLPRAHPLTQVCDPHPCSHFQPESQAEAPGGLHCSPARAPWAAWCPCPVFTFPPVQPRVTVCQVRGHQYQTRQQSEKRFKPYLVAGPTGASNVAGRSLHPGEGQRGAVSLSRREPAPLPLQHVLSCPCAQRLPGVL